MNPATVTIEKHEPERRRRQVTAVYCGCSCCCCCCLHTLGAIVGAAVAPAIGHGIGLQALTTMPYHQDEETGQLRPLFRKPGLSAVTVFWWLLCLLIFLGFALGSLQSRGGESLMITGIIVLLVFPALQVASAFITLLIFACWPRHDKLYQMKQLAKIFGGVILGSILGIMAMVAIGVAMSAIH